MSRFFRTVTYTYVFIINEVPLFSFMSDCLEEIPKTVTVLNETYEVKHISRYNGYEFRIFCGRMDELC